jgi:hypothetical protein
VRPAAVKDGLNAHLPDGISVTHCELVSNENWAAASECIHYRIVLAEPGFDRAKLNTFNAVSEVIITLSNRKGKLKKINLKDIVIATELFDSLNLELTLRSEAGKNVRPSEVLRHIFNLSEGQLKQATIIKLSA